MAQISQQTEHPFIVCTFLTDCDVLSVIFCSGLLLRCDNDLIDLLLSELILNERVVDSAYTDDE